MNDLNVFVSFHRCFFDDSSFLFCRWTSFYFLVSRLCFVFYWTTFWNLTNDCRTSFKRRLFSSCYSSKDLSKSTIFFWWSVNFDNLSTQHAASIETWWINELYAAFRCSKSANSRDYSKKCWKLASIVFFSVLRSKKIAHDEDDD